MWRRIIVVGSAILMLTGLVVLTWGFRDLPIDQRPEWMVIQMILWPFMALGLMELLKMNRYVKNGYRLRVDRLHLFVHGIPALVITATPPGLFTNLLGPTSLWALLDFPTAKVMAALWLSYAFWSAWEVSS